MKTTPTLTAIENAIKKADAMHGTYTCEALPGLSGRYYVQHNVDAERCYHVDVRPSALRCSCPAFEKAATCKHLAFAHEHQLIEEGEARAAAEEEAMLEAQEARWEGRSALRYA